MRPEKKKTRAALGSEQRKEDVRALMAMASGRRVFWDVLARLNVFSDTAQTDLLRVGRFLGARSRGLELMAEIIETCPDEYLLMQREAMQSERIQKEEKPEEEEEPNA